MATSYAVLLGLALHKSGMGAMAVTKCHLQLTVAEYDGKWNAWSTFFMKGSSNRCFGISAEA